MMEIRPLTDRVPLDELLSSQPMQPFLQSWAWSEFQAATGRPVTRLGAYDGRHLIGALLVIEHQLVMGQRYLYCPHGPVVARSDAWPALLEALRTHGRSRQAMYIKVDPGFEAPNFPAAWTAGTTLQPQHVWVVDIPADLTSLLSAMHQKTRYNIHLAERKGITVRWSDRPEDLAPFLQLLQATASRHHIHLHADSYYRQLFTTLGAAGMASLVFAELERTPIAAHLIIWHHQTATYLHGGSSDAYKELMAPHLLQWEIIREAARRGMRVYDLGGVAPPNESRHHWSGITRFKQGFGGRMVAYPGSANLVLQRSWYLAYRLAKRYRRWVH